VSELHEMRSTLAEIAVTLVGFSVIFRAFTAQRAADEHSDARVTVIVEIGLAVVALCFLPEILVAWGVAKPVAFKAASGLMALYWLRWLMVTYQIRGRSHLTPIAYRIAAGLQFSVFGASAANAILISTDTLYTTAVFAALAVVGVSFWAQFRVERG
jgi:hypothetical protein